VSTGVTETRSRVPFYENKKTRRVSSRTFETEAEFLTTKLQKIKGLPQAHAFVKVPGKPGRFLRLPRVRTPWIPERTRKAGFVRIFGHPFYFKPGEPVIADTSALPTERSTKSLPAARVPEDCDSLDFAGPEVQIAPRRARKKKR